MFTTKRKLLTVANEPGHSLVDVLEGNFKFCLFLPTYAPHQTKCFAHLKKDYTKNLWRKHPVLGGDEEGVIQGYKE